MQKVFKRYELKYIITKEQKEKIIEAMKPYMELDKYGKTVIRNIYFDTADYRLIRRSIERPVYKEKLRIRSYKRVSPHENVFVELKKKYDGVVYKRRLCMSEETAIDWICNSKPLENKSQISREIDYFLSYYETLSPKVFLSYEREAYYCNDDGEFRVTFDDNIKARQTELSLEAEVGGTSILPQDKVLMEIKCLGAIPLWLTSVLTKEKIYKTPFSKYGEYYKKVIYPKGERNNEHF